MLETIRANHPSGQPLFLIGIPLLPVLIQRIRDFRQPCPIFDLFKQFRRSKILDVVR